jgi:glutaredoxin
MKLRFSIAGTAMLACTAWAACVLPAWAQYKVVAPDGSVTYTDRPPVDRGLSITPMGRTPGAVAPGPAAASLPVALRQLTQRYPVTLYTAADCSACATGRQWLAQRGVPYRERLILTEQDAQALNGLVGGRTVPALTIGAQAVRGFSETDWQAYLDAAGYARENKLPRGWQPPPPTQLVETAARPAVPEAPPAAPSRRLAPAPAAPVPPPAPPGGLRF